MSHVPDDPVSTPPHGIAGWPFGARWAGAYRPSTLPDGSPWPRVRVITLVATEAPRLSETVASAARQNYPEARHDLIPSEDAASSAIGAILADARVDAILVLRAGDCLAPGALIALCLEAALSGAPAVAGLRVSFDAAVSGLDVPALSGMATAADGPFTGGEILWSRRALADTLESSGTLDLSGEALLRAWIALRDRGVRIGRPVLLQHRPDDGAVARQSLSIVSLTGTGHAGGAGIGQRRLVEALGLAGHRVENIVLTDESPPAAAEWTDTFPRAERAVQTGGHDLVLAGNLHGATRSLDILGRLGATIPTMAVLHDLFALTGRCAQPRACSRIHGPGCDAGCPSPDKYPQLARGRIAEAFASKRGILAAPRGPLLLANSTWTLEQARRLAPTGATFASVTLGFPTGVFKPGDRRALRRTLGLPEHDVLILISAVIVDGPDKGFGDLVACLRSVSRPGLGFVAIGRLDDPARLGLPNLFSPGPVGEESRLAEWYGACDLHVTASRLETLGQTAVEAGLCGTPTIAYRAGGLTTAIIDGVSGRLVEDRPGAMAEAIAELVADAPLRRRLGAFARIALENRFSLASAAMSLDRVFRERGLVPDEGRLRFAAGLLGRLGFAMDRSPGATGTVQVSASRIIRALRRAKQAVLGRNLPPILRRGLYLVAKARMAVRPGRRAP